MHSVFVPDELVVLKALFAILQVEINTHKLIGTLSCSRAFGFQMGRQNIGPGEK